MSAALATASLPASVPETVLSGSLALAIPLAVLAGLVSFASPCVLPLVPGYLGYVTGLSGVDLEQQRRGRMLAGATGFIAGFTAIYVPMGVLAGAAGQALLEHRAVLGRILGGVTILLGLVFAGWLARVPGLGWLSGRGGGPKPGAGWAGLVGAPLLGAAFAIGWTACTGPTLGAILALSGLGGDPARGAVLATAYCVGLGVPFLLAAVAYRRVLGALGGIRRHQGAVQTAGGLLLIAGGLLLVTGWWDDLLTPLQAAIAGFETAL